MDFAAAYPLLAGRLDKGFPRPAAAAIKRFSWKNRSGGKFKNLPIHTQGIPKSMEMGGGVVIEIDGGNGKLSNGDPLLCAEEQDIHFIFVAFSRNVQHKI